MKAFKPRVPQLVVAWPKMSREEQTHVGEMHLHFEAQFKAVAATGVPLESIAFGIHDKIDEFVRDKLASHPRAPEVACRKGCSHCCHINVTITKPEAVLLHLYAKHQGIELDHGKLERQAATHDNPAEWAQLDRADRTCVFLDQAEGTCRVYEHRPDACRKYHVIGDPEQCSTDKHYGEKVLNFVSIVAEVVASAALATFEHGGMAAMLLRHQPTREDPQP